MVPRLLRMLSSRRVDPRDVKRAYRLLFNRAPESSEVIQMHAASQEDVWSLLDSLMHSPEFKGTSPGSAHVCTALDWYPMLQRYQQANLAHRPGQIVNFLGISTDVTYLKHLSGSPGYVEGLPIPGDFHSSTSEWIAGMRGVELSGDTFTIVELGAGWGPWMVNLSRAAGIKGARRTLAIGCEADELHCRFMLEHLAANGFTSDEFRLFQGAVGPAKGVTLFPVAGDSSDDWGLRPIFCATDAEADAIMANPRGTADYRGLRFRQFRKVPCYTLAEILAGLDRVDVLHVDLQGSEAELVRANRELLLERVGYLVIGTHSRQIEGELIGMLCADGWQLEVEEPCQFDISDPNLSVRIDGTQGWRNRALGGD